MAHAANRTGLRGCPVIIYAESRYLYGVGSPDLSGLRSLSMRWIELIRGIDSPLVLCHS